MRLFIRILSENLHDTTSDAKTAGLHSSIFMDGPKMIINISGFNEKIPTLLCTILEYIRDFSVNLKVFDQIKDKVRIFMFSWKMHYH